MWHCPIDARKQSVSAILSTCIATCPNRLWAVRPMKGRGEGKAPGPFFASAPGPRHEGKPLEQMHVLFVLQQRAVQFGQGIRPVALEIFCRQIFSQ